MKLKKKTIERTVETAMARLRQEYEPEEIEYMLMMMIMEAAS